MHLRTDSPRTFGIALMILLCWLLCAATGTAEDTSATFGDVLDVRLVNVEVWVTDRQGEPVRGLQAADFEIREDGEPMAITHFAEGRSAASLQVPRVTRITEEETMTQAPEPQGLTISPGYLILYFDQLNMRPGGRKRLIQDLRKFLSSNEIPVERILVLRQQWDLYTEAPFGSSSQEINTALSRLASSTALGGQAESDKRFQIQQIQTFWEDSQLGLYADDPCDWFVKRSYEVIDSSARQARNQINTSLGHLAHTASFLAGLPGPKTLLYLSDALETNPGTEFVTFVQQLCPNSHEVGPRFDRTEELNSSLQQLTQHANANRVTLYTLQTAGLQTNFLGSADQGNIAVGPGSTFELQLRTNERAGLSFLAAETGGRAIFNRNRFGGELSKIANEMSSFYSLAYAPTHGGDGREHRIKVLVKGRGHHVRHRLSYRDRNAEERLEDQLKSALYLGVTNNPHGVRLGQGTVESNDSGGFVLPLHILVPPESITFVPGEDGPMARLRIQIDSRSDHQKGVSSLQKIFHAAPPPEGVKQLLDLPIDLPLTQGTHAIAVGVRDEATKEASILATTLAIQP